MCVQFYTLVTFLQHVKWKYQSMHFFLWKLSVALKRAGCLVRGLCKFQVDSSCSK